MYQKRDGEWINN